MRIELRNSIDNIYKLFSPSLFSCLILIFYGQIESTLTEIYIYYKIENILKIYIVTNYIQSVQLYNFQFFEIINR